MPIRFTLKTPLPDQGAAFPVLQEMMADLAFSTSLQEKKEKDGPHWYFSCLCVCDDVSAHQDVCAKRLSSLLGMPIAVQDLVAEDVPDQNWLLATYQMFQPFSVGPFFLQGSHSNAPVPPGKVGMVIDAATAFGSGEHPTTKGCLLALDKLKSEKFAPKSVLDMGTGSGILAIAAHKLWGVPVIAVDNDPEATEVACRHRQMNDVPSGVGGMMCKTGDGFKTDAAQRYAPYDLVIANILAEPLVSMADDLFALTAKNGTIVLSGLLESQANRVLTAYEDEADLTDRFDIDDWSALVLRRR